MANNETVVHAWAHQTGCDTSGPSIFYEGETIYSYGRHFPMARLVRAGNSSVVLMNSSRYGTTTSKHQSYVRGATSHLTCFEVPDVTGKDHAANYEAMARAGADLVAKSAKARKGNEDWYLSKAGDTLESANRYASLFGLKRPVLTLASLGVAIKELDARMRRAKAKAAREAKEAQARRFAEQETARQEWLSGERSHWHGKAADGSALLRVVGGELQTSQGVTVPLTHAVKVFRFVKMVRENGKAWERNGHVIRVGHFHVDRIDADGGLIAGCHRIGWPEIERVAALVGVVDAPASMDAVERKEAPAHV